MAGNINIRCESLKRTALLLQAKLLVEENVNALQGYVVRIHLLVSRVDPDGNHGALRWNGQRKPASALNYRRAVRACSVGVSIIYRFLQAGIATHCVFVTLTSQVEYPRLCHGWRLAARKRGSSWLS